MRLFKSISEIDVSQREAIAAANYAEWCANPRVGHELKKELDTIKNDKDALISGFLTLISFGTAGLRGKMKVGSSNMNVHTVELATQALASIVLKNDGAQKGVAIAYDSRNNSEEFSRRAACVLAANGIKVYLFDALRPTPELSYAIRRLGCKAGINVTASHNPKEDNGYKVYWEDGAQLPPEEAAAVSAQCMQYDFFKSIKTMDYDKAVSDGLITVIGEELDEQYLSELLTHIISQNNIEAQNDLKIVYTPLHGAGHALVPEVLRRAGFKNVTTVPEQMILDGNFPTVKKPNPQYKESYELACKMADENGGCDIILATDPDADRVGICAPDRDGNWFLPTGNQAGLMMLDYIIKQRRKNGTLADNACAVKSIVSTKLAESICRKNGVEMINVYTGFKYIGEKIKEFERDNSHTFIFGFEESYGYLSASYARDKDAVATSLLICEMAAYHKSRGITLREALEDIYREYGFSAEMSYDVVISALDIKGKMKEIMSKAYSLHETSDNLGGLRIVKVKDYHISSIINTYDKSVEKLPFVPDDVVAYELEDLSEVIIRPSGTEPKFKVYCFITADNFEKAAEKFEKIRKSLFWIEE
ncbi:MAG: phospho-sugar mutase [Ruminococcaceae bacterium]|nr:phospho-sugar mutase [Oscillospiraceae bacterium]